MYDERNRFFKKLPYLKTVPTKWWNLDIGISMETHNSLSKFVLTLGVMHVVPKHVNTSILGTAEKIKRQIKNAYLKSDIFTQPFVS